MANRPRVIFTWLLAALAVLLAIAPANVRSGGPEVVSSTLRPQLLLITAAPAKLAALRAPPFTIHAALGDPQANQYIASGTAQALAYVESKGFAVKLLDADTSGKVYYFLDTVTDGARTTAQRVGTIVFADDTVLLLAIPAIRERTALETLLAGGMHVQLLSSEAIPSKPFLPGYRILAATFPAFVWFHQAYRAFSL